MVSSRAALFTLVTAVAAQNSTSNCPAGFVEGFNSQVLDIVVQPADVWNLIGDFGNLSWAGVSQTNLSDPSQDNVPGVSRTSVQLGFFINETLLAYSPFDGASLTASELHSMAPFSVLPVLNTTVSAYADALYVSPLCGGAATRLTFDVNYCAMPAYASIVDTLFTTAHYSQLVSAQTILGAQNYTESSCVGGTVVSTNGTSGTNSTSTGGSGSSAASTTSSTSIAGATSVTASGAGGTTSSSGTNGSAGSQASNGAAAGASSVSSLPKAAASSASTLTSSFLYAVGFAMASLML